MFGENGLIKQAEYAKDLSANSTESEYEGMNRLYEEYANIMSENNEIPIFKSEVEQAKEGGKVFDNTTTIRDGLNNDITIPGGFKIAEDSGDTIQQGIVIEDVSASTDENVQGSQYVWVPVGTFIKDDGTESSEIILGRYTFDTTDGTPHLEQAAYTKENETNYTNEVLISIEDSEYEELLAYREGIVSAEEGINATAKDLAGFVESVKTNGGYYIGRYEASYASGAESTTNVGDYSNCMAASKISTGYSTISMEYNAGTLWNYITQVNASKVAINTYGNSSNVISDLVNSYAWDTTIVYIQEAGNINYSNKSSENTTLANTGNLGDELKDEACKINDMASNIKSWSTEAAYLINEVNMWPCTNRGGYCDNLERYTAHRNRLRSNYSDAYNGFRIILYIK